VPDGDIDTARKVVADLDRLDPDRARYIAAFACLLGRVAIAHREYLSVLCRLPVG
jgi:hypothetical protein